MLMRIERIRGLIAQMIGRKVESKWDNFTGRVIKWDPLSAAMCDTVVEDGNGKQLALGSHMLKPVDGGGPLPTRAEAIKQATVP